MAHPPEERGPGAGVLSPDSIRAAGPAGIAILMGAFAFFLLAANDNMPGGPDDDDLWENLKRLFDPPFNHG